MTGYQTDKQALMLAMLRRGLGPREVCFSRNAVARFGLLGARRAVVFAGQSSARSGFLDRVTDSLEKSDTAVRLEQLPPGEPTFDSVSAMASILREHEPDWIMAVGGGRVIDPAKVAWAVYEQPDIDLTVSHILRLPALGTNAKLAAVPTTAGSGAETSAAAVLSDAESGRKRILVSDAWLPNLVVLDPAATRGAPMALTAQTAFDALTHGIEAYVSKISNVLVQAHGSAAVRLILDALPVAMDAPDDADARERLLCGSYLAGLAQSMGSTGITHSLSHALGAIAGVPHALATALCLIPGVLYNKDKEAPLYEDLARQSGYDDFDAMLGAIRAGYESSGLPGTVGEAAGEPLSGSALDAAADAAYQDVCLKTNPVKTTVEDLRGILEALA